MSEFGRARNPLTARQSTALRFIVDQTERHGRAPTLKEIGAEIGVGLAVVYTQVTALERKGYIVRRAHALRGITVLKAPPAA